MILFPFFYSFLFHTKEAVAFVHKEETIFNRITNTRKETGAALTGYYASNIDYSYVLVARKRISNSKTNIYGRRPYENLTLKEALTVKPILYSPEELNKLRITKPIKPRFIIISSVYDKPYLPCQTKLSRKGARIIVHEDWYLPSHTAEIALLKASKPFLITTHITLPQVTSVSFGGSKSVSCQAVGYGSLKMNRSVYFNPRLTIIGVEVFPPKMCEMITKTYDTTLDIQSDTYVCSYNTKYRYGSPLSQGDSGCPLVCNGSVVGISQWIYSPEAGYLSVGPSQPTPQVYTLLSSYENWLKKYTTDMTSFKPLTLSHKRSSDEIISNSTNIFQWESITTSLGAICLSLYLSHILTTSTV